MSSSTALSLMPARLRAPLVSAALELQKSRCSLPGDRDCRKVVIIMSKSKLSSRFWYWAVSTVLTRASMPSLSRFLVKGRTIRSNAGDTSRISKLMVLPLTPWVSLPFRICQPASLRSRVAVRRLARMLPEPSVFGGAKTLVNTS